MRGKILNREFVDQINLLRSHGYSLPEISEKTNIPRTTVFRYVKNTPILEEYKSNWFGKRGGSRKRKEYKISKAIESGKELVSFLSEKEKALILAMLYWAEGGKRDFSFTNSDPEMIKVFIEILKEKFLISEDRLRISLRIYDDLDDKECRKYWSKIIGLPCEKILKTNTLIGKKKGKLSYGMCRVRILKGGDVLKQINGIIKAVSGQMSP